MSQMSNSIAPQMSPGDLAKLIDSGEAKLLNDEEVATRKTAGDLPAKFALTPGIGVYCIKKDKEYLMITNILCPNCKRLDNNKVARCPEHKKKHKKGKKGMGQDDDSDREKLGGLRHVDNDEEEEMDQKIDNAVTPHAVITIGPGGAPILVTVNPPENAKVGPRAAGMHHVKGILVRGPMSVPQFIPNNKLTNEQKLKFENYVSGELVLDSQKREIFVPDKLNPGNLLGKNFAAEINEEVKKAAGADYDKDLMKKVGEGAEGAIPVQAEMNENGMAMYRVTPEGVKDKTVAAGVLIKHEDQVTFVQVAGRELGGGKNAPLVPTTPEDMNNLKPGDHVADIVIDENGKPIAVKPGEAGNRKTIAKVIVGNKGQFVTVPVGEDNKKAIVAQEKFLTPETVEKLNKMEIKIHARVTGQAEEHVQQRLQDMARKAEGDAGTGGGYGGGGGNTTGPVGYTGGSGGEIRSVAFNNQYGGSQFARAVPQGGGNRGGPARGPGGEVRSVAFGAAGGGGGGDIRSVAVGAGGAGAGFAGGAGGGGFAGGAGGAGGGGYAGGAGGAGGGGYAGAAGGAGGARAGGAAGGGSRSGGPDVRSVAFGAGAADRSVAVGAYGAGGAGGAGAAGGGKWLNANPSNGNVQGGARSDGKSGAEVASTMIGGKAFGASVYMKK